MYVFIGDEYRNYLMITMYNIEYQVPRPVHVFIGKEHIVNSK